MRIGNFEVHHYVVIAFFVCITIYLLFSPLVYAMITALGE